MFSVKAETPYKENVMLLPTMDRKSPAIVAIKDLQEIAVKSKRQKLRSHQSHFIRQAALINLFNLLLFHTRL